MRTCIGCRTRADACTLIRVALSQDGRLVVDRAAPGRGAWLCRSGSTAEAQCVAKAAKRRAFSRALHREVDPAEVDALLAEASGHARIEQAN